MKCERKLVMLGYENVTQVEHPGEFAVRGGDRGYLSFDRRTSHPYGVVGR